MNRIIDLTGKERKVREQFQTEVNSLKEEVDKLESTNKDLTLENKSVAPLKENVEELQNELAAVRKKYKENKKTMMARIKSMETESIDKIQDEVRELAMSILDKTAEDQLENSMNSIGSKGSIVSLSSLQGQSINGNIPDLDTYPPGVPLKKGGIHYEVGFDNLRISEPYESPNQRVQKPSSVSTNHHSPQTYQQGSPQGSPQAIQSTQKQSLKVNTNASGSSSTHYSNNGNHQATQARQHVQRENRENKGGDGGDRAKRPKGTNSQTKGERRRRPKG